MKKCLLHSKTRTDAPWKDNRTTSKRRVLISLKSVKKNADKPNGVRINTHRVDHEAVHAQRVLFNQQHFACKEYYHQTGKKTWIGLKPKKEIPTTTVKRIIQILVPSNFFCITDKTRKKTVYKRDVTHKVRSVEEKTVNIKAHAENAVKEMLLKEGISKDFIMTKKNVCYVTLHKQASEEKICSLFPTLHMQVFKVKN